MASYRFTLRTQLTAVVFGSDKVRNWQDIEPELIQHEVYRGIFREFSNTFEFVGDIRRLIIETLDTYGPDAKIYLIVEVGNDNKDKWSFEPISAELLANLSNCEISENAAALDFADNDFTSKFFNNHDKKVNLDITEDFEGNEITPVPLNDVYLHDRTLIFNSQIKTTNDVTRHSFHRIPIGDDNTDAKITIPCIIKYKSDSNFKSIYAGKNLPTGAREFYLKSEKDRIIKINYNLKFKLKGYGAFAATRWKLILKHVKTTPVEYVICQSTGYGGNYPNVIRDAEYITINESFENTYIINEGDSLELYLHFGILGYGVVFLSLDATDIDIFGTSSEYFDPTTAKVLLPIELFTQLLQIYTGVKLPFYSNYFGRTELGYSVDGPGAYLAIMNGKMARGFPWEVSQFNISFKEVFEELNKIKNLVAVIENVGGNYRFRIDKYEDLANNVVIDIGKNFKELSRTTDEKAMISEISVGYKDLIIEEVNGLLSYNGEVNYVTPLQIKGQKLDLLSEWIASDIAIEVTRRQHYSLFPSKGWKFDKDIFIIDCKSQKEFLNGEWIKLNLPLLPIINEDYEIIQGIYEPNRAYNLNLSPKRNLLNWQKEIKSSLLHKIGDTIKMVKGANNPALVTKKAGEQTTIIESSDLIISQLDSPYNTSDLIMIGEAQLTRAQWNLIRNNPCGLICFESKGNKIYARVQNISFAINRKTCNFELIRANY